MNEIEKMANICYANKDGWSNKSQGFCYAQAEALANAGYGSIEQAVRGFAEELKRCFPPLHCYGYYSDDIIGDIDSLIKKRFGNGGA